jgi:hypothetical protein
MSNTQNNSQAGTDEAKKAPQPSIVTPAPQQNQGDKPAEKSAEQRK